MEHKVSVTPVAEGNSDIAVASKQSINFAAPSNVHMSVNVELPVIKPIADLMPLEIQEIVRDGQAASNWAVGDLVPISMNGKVGLITISGTWYARIIGINHNTDLESGGAPNVHFQTPFDASGNQLAFCDSRYGSIVNQDGTGFCMNPSYTYNNEIYGGTVNGWLGSYAYKTIVPQYFAALTQNSGWKSIISDCVKYSNIAYKFDEDLIKTTSKIFYLAPLEMESLSTAKVGSVYNPAEATHQQQYAYYVNGSSHVFYNYNQVRTRVVIWLRSVVWTDTRYFHLVNNNTTGTIMTNAPYVSYGMAPCFQVS